MYTRHELYMYVYIMGNISLGGEGVKIIIICSAGGNFREFDFLN